MPCTNFETRPVLKFDSSWRHDSPGAVPIGVVRAFSEFISRIAPPNDRYSLLEHFKQYFAQAAGADYHPSSNQSWAQTDLDKHMELAAANAPLFIEAFYLACADLHPDEYPAVPDVARINLVLAEHRAGYEIRPPRLIATENHVPVAVPERTPSFTEQARAMIEESLAASERFLNQSEGRRAVSEILWLLETVSTAFRDDKTVQGKYFNLILKDMKNSSRGKAQEQILNWMTTLHGYLSSPTGGGVRHGMDLKDGIAIQLNEARLYCNLIRSYITFLIEEHESAGRAGAVPGAPRGVMGGPPPPWGRRK
jgi:hypothetical protein